MFSLWLMQAHPNGILPTPAGFFETFLLIDLQPDTRRFIRPMPSFSTPITTAWGSRFPDYAEARYRDLP